MMRPGRWAATVWPVSESLASTGRVKVEVSPEPGDRRSDERRPSEPGSGLTPRWLARLGWSGWMVTGTVAGVLAVAAATGVLVSLLSPLILAVLLAPVLQPMVGWLRRHRVRPGLAATIGALALPAFVALLTVVVLLALRGQGAQWRQAAQSAAARLRSGTGTDPLTPLLDATERRELLLGIGGLAINGAVAAIALLIWVLLAVYILFFLLKDGPRFAERVVRQVRLPAATTRDMLNDAGLRVRRYFVGTTVVAAMDAVVITLAAVLLRLPLLPVIALVTFVAAFVPYLGAWLSGIFVVVVALGSGGVATALWMLLIVLITQNVLEGVARPLAYGAALDLHPLTVLAATLLGGLLGGLMGVLIAPPLVAIVFTWIRTARSTAPATRTSGTRSG